MAGKRSFSPKDIPQKTDDYHGKCQIAGTNPPLPETMKSVNIILSFDEAMKLSVAVQGAVLALNRHNRATSKGRKMGMCLSLKLPEKSLAVIEQTVAD